MQTINVFVASSYELSDWREVLGDTIRLISQEYETKGFRVKMKCWEDFRPEYTGTRKQTEYNEDLVKNSQICIAMFATKCGAYTQEEVRIAKQYMPGQLFCVQRKVDADTSVIKDFLAVEGLWAIDCGDAEELKTLLWRCIDSYIQLQHHPNLPVEGENKDKKIVYATIPEDMAHYHASFGNMIRSLDDIIESNLNMRCQLCEGDKNLISQSHYYSALLKESLSQEDEAEIVEAISRVSPMGNPQAVAIYCNHDDGAIQRRPALKSIVEKAGLFPETMDIMRVRYNLFIWLLANSVLRIDKVSKINIEKDWVTFFGERIAPYTILGIDGKNDAERYARLLELITCQLLLQNVPPSADYTKPVDISQLDTLLDNTKSAYQLASNIQTKANQQFKDLNDQLTVRIKYLLQQEDIESHIVELEQMVQAKIKVEQQMVEIGLSSHRDLLRTQMLMVQLSDTYPREFAATNYDIDLHYKLITDTADRYGVLDPTVEAMRMNYANYLARQNQNNESLQIYRHAISRLNQLDDASRLMQTYIVHLYITYINQLVHLGEKEQALQTIEDLQGKILRWKKEDKLSPEELLFNNIMLMACRLRIRPIDGTDEHIVANAFDLHTQLLQIQEKGIPEELWEDLCCDFPNTFAAYLIDREVETDKKEDYHQAYKLLTEVIQNAQCAEENKWNASPHYLSDAYHNLGFILHNENRYAEAREPLIKALEIRRAIYAGNQYVSCLGSIAETLLLLGATYVGHRIQKLTVEEEREALKYADECLSLYTSLNTEQHPEQETCIYKAKLLRGTILYYSLDSAKHTEGYKQIVECRNWNRIHPGNSYESVIESVASRIVKNETIHSL